MQDYGVVTDPDKAFVYTSMVAGAGYTNYNGVAGGCVVVTIDGNGKVVAAFNDLKLAGDGGQLEISATLREQ